MIDDEDAELVAAYRWRVLVQPHTCYAVARLPRLYGKQRSLYLHRLILHAGPGERVEHKDHDGLMNCRANLRIRPVGLGAMTPTSARPSSRDEGVAGGAKSGKGSASLKAGAVSMTGIGSKGGRGNRGPNFKPSKLFLHLMSIPRSNGALMEVATPAANAPWPLVAEKG